MQPISPETGQIEPRNAAAINAEIGDDAPGAVNLPAGDFTADQPITLGSRSSLSGEGAGITVITPGRDLGQAVIANTAGEEGNRDITLSDLTVDCAGRADIGALFVRVENLRLSNVELRNCRQEGLRASGKGRQTRGIFLDNVEVHDNGGDGMIVLWASRESFYTNIRSYANGRTGIVIDHSEGLGVNLLANGNAGNGIFFRNLFASSFSNVAATRNGRHGIFAQGFVESLGTNWRAQSNSRAEAGRYDELFLSGAADLSYGVSRNSVLEGVIAGGYAELGPSSARYGVTRAGEGVDVAITGIVYGETLDGTQCLPADPCSAASAP